MIAEIILSIVAINLHPPPQLKMLETEDIKNTNKGVGLLIARK